MADRVGQQLGNYRLVRLLGQGSYAEVYLGQNVHLKTEAAVKVLRTQLADSDVENFLREAQTIARLVHPHIVRIFDFDVQEGTPFLVMDYASNGTLRQRHPRGTQLPLHTIVAYVKQVADALQYAHDRQLIHRDVKPENMLIGRNNEILLSDFGTVQVAQSTHMEGEQKIAGTVAYISPEQLQGKARVASDQYALGIVVYEWLSGERPFQGPFSQMASQHLFTPPAPLHEKIPAIPSAVDEVVMTALAKDPRQRFHSVQAFANALEQASNLGRARGIASPALPTIGTDRTTRESWPLSASLPSSTGPVPIVQGTPQVSGVPNDTPPFPQSQHIGKASHVELIGRPAPPSHPATRSPGSGLSSFFTEADNALAKFFSRRGSKNQQETELSLFAIARTTLEADDRAFVGKVYTVLAGASQNRPADFRGGPFTVSVQNPTEPLLFGILLHPSGNIELIGARYQLLRYDPRDVGPQYISCPFRLKEPGQSYLVINFYRERQWLQTIRFEFEGVVQPTISTTTRGR